MRLLPESCSTRQCALAGEYTLTFIAASACANLPAELQNARTYAVTIGPGGSHLAGLSCQR